MPPQMETMDYLSAAAPITRSISGIAQQAGGMAQAVIDPIVERHNNNYQNGVAYAQIKDAFGHLAGTANVDLDTLAPQKDEPSQQYHQRVAQQIVPIIDQLAASGMNPRSLMRLVGQPGVSYDQIKGHIGRYSATQAQTVIAGGGRGQGGDMDADIRAGQLSVDQINQKYGTKMTQQEYEQRAFGTHQNVPLPMGPGIDSTARAQAAKTAAGQEQPSSVGNVPTTYTRAKGILAEKQVPEEMQAPILAPIAQRQAAEAAQTPGATPMTTEVQAGLQGLPAGTAKPFVEAGEKQQTFGLEKQKAEEQARNDLEKNKIDWYKALHQPDYKQFLRGQVKDQRLFDRLTKLGTDLDPSQTVRTAMGVSKLGFDRAERLQSLFYQFPNLDRRQTEELAIGLNSMLQGSNQAEQQQVKALVPQTMWGNGRKIIEWLTNNPQGLDQQSFTKRMGETIDREKQTFIKQIQRNQYARIAKYADVEEGLPDDFKNLLESMGVDYSDYQQWKAGGRKPISAVVGQPGGGSSESKQDAENKLIAKARNASDPEQKGAQKYLKSQGISW
jgi:hypothetical protein